jgi:hypothetical protein
MMKKYIATLIAGSAIIMAGSQIELYKVKSGKIDYSIKGSGDLMGMTMETVGKKRMLFTDYGALSLTEENKVSRQEGVGQSSTEKSHTLTYMKNGVLYQVDFDQKRIVRMDNAGAMMAMMSGGQTNMAQAGEKMMKQMGGKKTGTDKVLGYTCDVWELMGSKQCIYKGIPLKVVTNVMGIKNTEIATKAVFDIDLEEDDFKLPDFPLYDMNGQTLDKASLAAMDAASEKEMEANLDLMNEMKSAAQKAGITPGKEPTLSQQNAMMDAMLPMMKQDILREETNLHKVRNCIERADTLNAVKSCARAMGDTENEAEGFPSEWNDKIKQQTLSDIDRALEGMSCVKKAKSMQEAQMCMGAQ